jgi:hypothetical protein
MHPLDKLSAALDEDNGGDQQQDQQQDQDNELSEDGSVASSATSDIVVVTATETADLKQNVGANLNVLAGLFPFMAARQPRVRDAEAFESVMVEQEYEIAATGLCFPGARPTGTRMYMTFIR